MIADVHTDTTLCERLNAVEEVIVLFSDAHAGFGIVIKLVSRLSALDDISESDPIRVVLCQLGKQFLIQICTKTFQPYMKVRYQHKFEIFSGHHRVCILIHNE